MPISSFTTPRRTFFNLEGTVMGGPAPKPLTRFTAKLEGERVSLALPDKP